MNFDGCVKVAGRLASVSAICLAAGVAFAAEEGRIKGPPSEPIKFEQAAGDTLQMTCAQARSMVKGPGGVILKTGVNHFDRYHRKDGVCEREKEELQPAFVRTRDNPLCFVGYTCEAPNEE